MRTLLVLSFTLLLQACATKVTSLTIDEDLHLKENVGYVLLGIQTNQNLKSIKISGQKSIELTHKDLKKGTNYLLVNLEAGNYKIERVELNQYFFLRLNKEDNWEFKINPGKINYVGHLEIVRRGYWDPISYTELMNRSSEAMEFLQKEYPNILESRMLIYSGPGDDIFYDFISKNHIGGE